MHQLMDQAIIIHSTPAKAIAISNREPSPAPIRDVDGVRPAAGSLVGGCAIVMTDISGLSMERNNITF
jgi:hypothetical protein